MVFNDLVFLCANFYDRDGQPRCYAQFASFCDGQLFTFAAHHWRKADQPQRFAVCDVKGKIRQFGQNVSFILEDYDVAGHLDFVQEVVTHD